MPSKPYLTKNDITGGNHSQTITWLTHLLDDNSHQTVLEHINHLQQINWINKSAENHLLDYLTSINPEIEVDEPPELHETFVEYSETAGDDFAYTLHFISMQHIATITDRDIEDVFYEFEKQHNSME